MTLNPEHLTDKAMRLLDSGRPMEARALYAEICRLTPHDPDAWLMAAAISGDLGLIDEAYGHLQRALTLDPAFADAHLAIAALDHGQGKHRQALQACDLALAADGEFEEAWLRKSAVLADLERYTESVECARKAIALAPDCADAYVNLGHGLHTLKQYEQAIRQYRRALDLNPHLHTACTGAAEALMKLGQIEAAEAACARAIELAPQDPCALRARASVLHHLGRTEEAFDILEPMIEAGAIDASAAVNFANICTRLGQPEKAVSLIENMLAPTEGVSDDSRWKLHLTLGRLYDTLRDYDRAFEQFQQGHRFTKEKFDPVAHRNYVDRVIDRFDRDTLARLPRASVKSEVPVFIVGMPRSGTTLVEQILDCHPDVFGAGELPSIGVIIQRLQDALGGADFPECISALTPQIADNAARSYLAHLDKLSGGDTPRATDKMPGNFMDLGLIELLFPNARVIHCVRNPLDTCLSCYSQNFSGHEYTHDLTHLGSFYNDYRRIMQHWRSVLSVPLLEVQYESLIEDIEQGSRRLVEFCALPWDARCLRFYENKRSVITASHDQVRKPVYKTSAERWRNYERHLEPLAKALKDPG
jgi:tetratricopeptide (TPR) repeat protein